MKKVLSVQDISCVGKCSLTVALPILSSVGVECQILPTSLLSNHTMFKSFTFLDLTDECQKIVNKFQENEFKFDCIYSGYLGSVKQIELMFDIINKFKKDCEYVVVDPAMADDGKFYPGFDKAFGKKMFELCLKADIILPNITEACFMLDVEYKSRFNKEEIEAILNKFHALGCKNVIITGVSFEEDRLGYAYKDESGHIEYYFNELIKAKYHGSGDVFASSFVGALMNNKSMFESAKIAAYYVCESLNATLNDENRNWYGLNFEQTLPLLIEKINK